MPATGVPVTACAPGSPAHRAGIRPGDLVERIDGHRLEDSLDAYFLASEPSFAIAWRRGTRRRRGVIRRRAGQAHGLAFADPPVRRCANRCPFCFIAQLPPAGTLRDGLDVRDDDYRHSFLHGYYVTLTNLDPRDLDRIIRLGLSPLYVSVHATEPALRARLLGRKSAPILPLLTRLASAGIALHTQIVVIRGWNDGAHLARTVADLARLAPAVKSIAVVPVGLTAHHRRGVPAWTRCSARPALAHLLALGRRYPPGLVQAADEWFVLAGRALPPAAYYAGTAVAEDGVGLLRTLLDGWRRTRLPRRVSPRAFTVLCGTGVARFLRPIIRDLNRIPGCRITLRPVVNRTFGPQVNVTGLLAWRDLLPVARRARGTVVVPDILLDRDRRFLDGVSVAQAERACRRRLRVVTADASGFRSLLGRYTP